MPKVVAQRGRNDALERLRGHGLRLIILQAWSSIQPAQFAVRKREKHAVGSGAACRMEGGALANAQFEVIDESATRICRIFHATGAENRRVHEQAVKEDVDAAISHVPGGALTERLFIALRHVPRSRRLPKPPCIMSPEFVRASSDLGDSLDNAYVPIHCVAQHTECFLVPGAVVCGDCLHDAVEFNQDGAQTEAAVIHLGGIASREYPSAGTLKRGAGELPVSGESFGVVNSAIRGNPIGIGHRKVKVVVERDGA
jgi:hypothetical protein